MIVDNADDTTTFFDSDTAQVPQRKREMQHTTNLSRYLPQNAKGSILITPETKTLHFVLLARMIISSRFTPWKQKMPNFYSRRS